jgi:integrase
MSPPMAERRKRTKPGSVFQRTSDGRWMGVLQAGFRPNGNRRVITRSSGLTGDAGYRAVNRELDRLIADIAKNGAPTTTRTTIKTWADEWLSRQVTKVRPKSYAADEGAVRRWIVPTIGRRRLADLRPADVRAVHTAMRTAGLKPSTMTRYHAPLMKMLRDAMLEGHPIPPNLLLVEGPGTNTSDREALDAGDAAAILALAAETLPHSTRWAAALLQGLRPSEALGLTWAAYDRVHDGIDISWQLQALPYLDKGDRSKGFRVPHNFETRHLKGRLHLTRPKTAAGRRVIPKLPFFAEAMETWRSIAPRNPHDLVWPAVDGDPADAKQDLAEWKALQATLGIAHPAGRFYVVHETRHTTASLLVQAGVDRRVIEDILGQVKLVEAYLHTSTVQRAEAMAKVGAALQLIGAAPAAIEERR